MNTCKKIINAHCKVALNKEMISGKKKIMHVMRFTRKQWKHGSTTQYIHTNETQRNVTDQFVDK